MDEEIVKKVKKYKEKGNRNKVDLDSVSDDKVQHLEEEATFLHMDGVSPLRPNL